MATPSTIFTTVVPVKIADEDTPDTSDDAGVVPEQAGQTSLEDDTEVALAVLSVHLIRRTITHCVQ